jgi:acyl-CoA thioester hydrolase
MEGMYSFDITYRVCYADTDKMGYLYYGHYARLYEMGRVETLRSLGVSYASLESDDRVIMPVVRMETRYLKPAFYDEVLTISTIMKNRPGRLIEFENLVINESAQLINEAHLTLCFVDITTNKMVRCPMVIQKALDGIAL